MKLIKVHEQINKFWSLIHTSGIKNVSKVLNAESQKIQLCFYEKSLSQILLKLLLGIKNRSDQDHFSILIKLVVAPQTYLKGLKRKLSSWLNLKIRLRAKS